MALTQISKNSIADDAVGSEHIEVLDAALQFGDNVKAQFGGGDDLQIFYDGTDAFIRNHVGGQIVCRANTNFLVQTNASDGGADNAIKALNNAAVELYYDNAKKLETTSYGAEVTGRLNVSNLRIPDYDASSDLGQIRVGNNNDLKVYHDGSNSYQNNSTGIFLLRTDDTRLQNAAGSENLLVAKEGDSVDLYFDGSKKFETLSSGVLVTGNCLLYDNHAAKFGTSQDLVIYHDATNSYVENALDPMMCAQYP